MRYLTLKDKKRRKQVAKKEKVSRLTSALSRVSSLPQKGAGCFYVRALVNINKVHITQLRDRCRYAGGARAVWRIFHVSRMVFKTCGHFGWFYGVKRVTW